MANNFYKDLARGKQGEVLISAAFQKMGYEVKDVSSDSCYWEKDIDLIVNDNGIERQIEVKSDWNLSKTGNVVLEIRKSDSGKAGWFTFTQSSHLAFVDMKNNIAYIGRTKEIKDAVDVWLLQGAAGADVSAYIKNKHLNGYFCLLLNIENSKLFQKLAV